MADNIDEELHGLVKSIVDELEAAVAGNLYKTDGGDFRVIEDMDGWKEDRHSEKVEAFEASDADEKWDPNEFPSFEDYRKHCVGTPDDVDEPEQATVADVIETRGLGDTRFEVNTSKELCGGKTLFTFGGPNIWVHDNMVCGYWGGKTVEMTFNSETRSAMFDWFKEFWEVVKA